MNPVSIYFGTLNEKVPLAIAQVPRLTLVGLCSVVEVTYLVVLVGSLLLGLEVVADVVELVLPQDSGHFHPYPAVILQFVHRNEVLWCSTHANLIQLCLDLGYSFSIQPEENDQINNQ